MRCDACRIWSSTASARVGSAIAARPLLDRQLADDKGGTALGAVLDDLELIDRQSWATRGQVRRAVFEFIEVFYNRRRLHSSLNYPSPAEYERQIHHRKAAQAA
jgi:transposase InsO family protein